MIKNILVLLLLISARAFACETPEAQFIGKISNPREIQRSESVTECYFNIRYSMFNPSQTCPLQQEDVTTYTFQDMNCSLREGDSISGVLKKVGEWIVID